MDGSLLRQFDAFDFLDGLALDPADHTLWTTSFPSGPYAPSGVLRQYSLSPDSFGNLLQAGAPEGLPNGTSESGEFMVTPEPSSFALVFGVLAGAISTLRRGLRVSSRI